MIPGVKAKHTTITPMTRADQTAMGAFDEAINRLRAEYESLLAAGINRDASYHLVLTVERPRLDVAAPKDDYVP